MAGTLYVVATPIGNLDDMVPRAVEVLQFVDLILAEDTRHSQVLLQKLGISTPTRACHEHNERELVAELIARLQGGDNLALISDAGTPLISDPGFGLVRAARDAAIEVVPIPGACAAVVALSASGLSVDRFTFAGFPPAKKGARSRWLEELRSLQHTLVIYESPHRILGFIAQLGEQFGNDRRMVVARELTKKFESWYVGRPDEIMQTLRSDSRHQRGEFVVLVEGSRVEGTVDEARIREHMSLLLTELPLARAAAIAAKLLNASKQDCYRIGLELSD